MEKDSSTNSGKVLLENKNIEEKTGAISMELNEITQQTQGNLKPKLDLLMVPSNYCLESKENFDGQLVKNTNFALSPIKERISNKSFIRNDDQFSFSNILRRYNDTNEKLEERNIFGTCSQPGEEIQMSKNEKTGEMNYTVSDIHELKMKKPLSEMMKSKSKNEEPIDEETFISNQ